MGTAKEKGTRPNHLKERCIAVEEEVDEHSFPEPLRRTLVLA